MEHTTDQRRAKKLKWFEYDQNNSGGSFSVDDVLCHEVWIEAKDRGDANRQFMDMGGYFDGVSAGLDCGCCGDRWSEPYREEKFPLEYGDGKIFESPEQYIKFCAQEHGKWFNKIYRMFYANGDMREFRYEDGEVLEKFEPKPAQVAK